MESMTKINRSDWIRFQVPDKRVLEGYVQEFSTDGLRVLIGKSPDSPENEWYRLSDLLVLKVQELMAPV